MEFAVRKTPASVAAARAARVRALEEQLRVTRAQSVQTSFQVAQAATRARRFPVKRFELPAHDDIVLLRPPPARAPRCYAEHFPRGEACALTAPRARRSARRTPSKTLAQAGALAMALSNLHTTPVARAISVSGGGAPATGSIDDIAVARAEPSAAAVQLEEISARNADLAAHIARIEQEHVKMRRTQAPAVALPKVEEPLTERERELALERDKMARRARKRETAMVHCPMCGDEVLYRRRMKHQSEECVYRLETCSVTGCGQCLRVRDMEFHHSARCGSCDACGVENCGAGEEHSCVFRSTKQIETAVVVGGDDDDAEETATASSGGNGGDEGEGVELDPEAAALAGAKARKVRDALVEATAPAAKSLGDMAEMLEKHAKLRVKIIERSARESPDLVAHSVVRKILFIHDVAMYDALDEEGWSEMVSELRRLSREWAVRAAVGGGAGGAKTAIVRRLLGICEECRTGERFPPGTTAEDFESVALCPSALKRQALAERGLESRTVLHDCPNGCGEQLPTAKLRVHARTRCKMRAVRCRHFAKGCVLLVRVCDMTQHLETECAIEKELAVLIAKGRWNRESVECGMGCGLFVPRSALEFHEESVCVNRLVACRKGCGQFFQMGEVEAHQLQCTPNPKTLKMIARARSKYVRPWVVSPRHDDDSEDSEDASPSSSRRT